MSAFNINIIRKDFPILNRSVYDKPLVYLDNAASTQKPRSVIERISKYYEEEHSNVHRGIHYLSQKATDYYEEGREKVQKFINAARSEEIIFTRGTTEGINLVANAFRQSSIGPGDEILISHMEHHSNIVPWQHVCEEKGATLKVIPINDEGELIMEEFEKLLNEKTRLVALVHVSNALGTINPVKEVIEKAHAQDVPVLIDGAQAIQHLKVDVQELDCDFYVFSGHKMYGPTGIGILYGKYDLLKEMPPYQGGGEMILSVDFDKTVYADVPHKFEAGTPHIAGVIGLGAAIDYINQVSLDEIAKHEEEVLHYGTEVLSGIKGLKMIGTAKYKSSVLSFDLNGIHPHDVGTIIDREGVAIRTGHHCAQPVMNRYGVPATSRASIAMYNTKEEIDELAKAIEKVITTFA